MGITELLSKKIYSISKKYLDPKIFKFLGQSNLFKPIRDRFLYKDNEPTIVNDRVNFENLSFYFEAPVKVLNHAKETGLEARITRVAMSQLNPGAIAIDVGANYGFITLVMAQSVYPFGKVISFEPDPKIWNNLQNSIAKNGLDATCILLNKFAGQPGEDGFITIDEVLSVNGIEKVDFIKVDVDGGDYHVLLGARHLLSNYHPPLVVEMGSNQDEIFNYLNDIGYIYFIGMDSEVVVPPNYPLNLFASISPLVIPPRGSFK